MNDRQQLRDELEDRLTDQALTEALGGKRPPDLSDDILTAALPRRRYWGMRPRVALAASLLLALGLGASAYLRFGADSSREVARVNRAVSSAYDKNDDVQYVAEADASRESRHREVVDMLASVERSHAPTADEPPITYPSREQLADLIKRRVNPASSEEAAEA